MNYLHEFTIYPNFASWSKPFKVEPMALTGVENVHLFHKVVSPNNGWPSCLGITVRQTFFLFGFSGFTYVESEAFYLFSQIQTKMVTKVEQRKILKSFGQEFRLSSSSQSFTTNSSHPTRTSRSRRRKLPSTSTNGSLTVATSTAESRRRWRRNLERVSMRQICYNDSYKRTSFKTILWYRGVTVVRLLSVESFLSLTNSKSFMYNIFTKTF